MAPLARQHVMALQRSPLPGAVLAGLLALPVLAASAMLWIWSAFCFMGGGERKPWTLEPVLWGCGYVLLASALLWLGARLAKHAIAGLRRS